MIRLKRQLVPVNGVDFDAIESFVTDTHIGIYDFEQGEFVMIPKSERQLSIVRLGSPDDLEALDANVYGECGEHIVAVSTQSEYRLALMDQEVETDREGAVA